MPDFTLTSPEGKSYTVTGPEGATQEQAFQVLQQQLSAGTAKESTPEPAAPTDKKGRMEAAIKGLKPDLKMDAEGKPTPTPTVKSALEAIGTSTALGGALGAVSPELLTGAGYAVSFIPEVGPTIGAALMEAGTAARASRVATAGAGALSGLAGETAGQTAEAAGANKGTADAARLVGGMGAGPGLALANKAKGLFGAFTKLIGVEATPAAVTKAAAALRGTEDAGVPANALHQMLQHGADEDIKSAQSAGEKVMADARQRAADVGSQDAKAAQKVLDDGKARADQIVSEAKKRAADLNKASGNRMATSGKVLAQAEPALRVVGQPREISDIGKELQTSVSQQHQAALDARTQAYNNLKDQRDSIVKAKEGAGQTVEQTEGMKDLKSYIKGKTDTQASPRQTTDQGTLRVYGQVNEALQNPSFEALDQVRRKLGDVLGGRDVEGYSAVGKDVAGKLYAKISDIQKEFVGSTPGSIKEVQPNFEPGDHWLEKQVSMGKTSHSAKNDAVEGADDLPGGLKLKKDPGYQAAYKVYAPSGHSEYPWKVVGKLSYGKKTINNLAVSPEFQKKGIAQQLLKKAESEGAIDPNIDPEDVSKAGAAAINKYRKANSGTNLQQMMQEQYHDASLGLRKFGTGAGGKAAAIDRVDPERFAADPAGVPKQFFSSQQSVRDLQELTGDSGLVQRAGSSYVSSQLRGMSAKQVQQFAQKNSDWLREVPGLQKGVADYATRLGKIEATAAKTATSAEGLAKRGAAILPEAEGAAAKERAETVGRAGKIGEGSIDTQQRVLQEGGKAAQDATKAAAAPAQNLKGILQGGERPEAVRDLLLNGKPEQTRLAARISSQTPEGRKALEGSVRQITADMKEGTLQKQWNERLKPMLKDGSMLTPDRMKALTKDVEGLIKAYSGKPPVTMVQRLISGAIASSGSNMIGQDSFGRDQ